MTACKSAVVLYTVLTSNSAMLFSFSVISMTFDRCAIKDYLLTYLLTYLRRRLASGEGIVTVGVTLSLCHAVCVSAALVSAAKVMPCIQCCLVYYCDSRSIDSQE